MKEFVEKLNEKLYENVKSNSCPSDSCLEHSNKDCDKCNFKKIMISDVIEIVNQLAEEYNNGWIPCSERLPETNESVLCWAKSTARGGDVCFVGSYHKGFWFLQSSANTHSFPGQYKIVAWQQLPEPYQKGE